MTHHTVVQRSSHRLAHNLDVLLVTDIRHFGGNSRLIDLLLVEEGRDRNNKSLHLGIALAFSMIRHTANDVGTHNGRCEGTIWESGNGKSRLSVSALHHFTATVVNVLLHLRSVDVTTNHAIDKAHSVLICPVVFKSCSSYSLYRTVIVVRNGRREEVTTINLNDAVFPSVHNNTDSV